MSESIYVGNAKAIEDKDGMIIDLDLTELFEYTKNDIHKRIRQWESKKDNKIHKTISLAVWPLKPENQTKYRTHSVIPIFQNRKKRKKYTFKGIKL